MDEKDKDPFYIVYSMGGVTSPDEARYTLEDALETLSFEFREHPTLPSDASDKTNHVAGALAKDTALLLPLKHCAFTHCSWCGQNDTDLLNHLLSDHIDTLRPSMDAFQHLRPVGEIDQNELGISVYNEALAIAIRRGAPLASFSIDRRCLRQYVQHSTDASTHATVCFVCAQRFVHVSGVDKYKAIVYVPLVARDVNEDLSGECDYLLGIEEKYAKNFFSLDAYCRQYGEVSSTVSLCEMSEEFDDWHLNVSLNGDDFKLLCCPEDVQCPGVDGIHHSKQDCCDKCVAPVCKGCKFDLAPPKPTLPPSSLSNDMMIFYPPKMLYEEKVTMIELICASVCITSIICFYIREAV